MLAAVHPLAPTTAQDLRGNTCILQDMNADDKEDLEAMRRPEYSQPLPTHKVSTGLQRCRLHKISYSQLWNS